MKKCILCRSAEVGKIHLGTLHFLGNMAVHENCLFMTTDLPQRDGITFNFALSDIRKAAHRTRHVVCTFCLRKGANIACRSPGCRKTFHTSCGLRNGARFQYSGQHMSYCYHHAQYDDNVPEDVENCAICLDSLDKRSRRFNFTHFVRGKCCKSGWYHKDCLQQYADIAGSNFKCPVCNDKEYFRFVCFWGIKMTDCHALWAVNGDIDD